MKGIEPGTIACIGLCKQPSEHRHELVPIFGPATRMREVPAFTGIIAALCTLYQLDFVHDADPRRRGSSRGWPDFEIVGNERIYRELKAYHGTLSVAQRRTGSRLAKLGGDWAVWRPAELYNGHIETKLREISE